METWFLYALLSALFAGLYSFFLKISAEKNHNSSLVITYSMFSAAFIAIIFIIFENYNFNLLWIVFLVGLGNSIFYFISSTTRIKSLQNIDTTIFFPLYKTLGPLLMIGISVGFFLESLSQKEAFGLFLGLIIPLLLISKNENKRQTNLKKGLIYLVIATIFGVISSSLGKFITMYDLNVSLAVFASYFTGGIISLTIYKKSQNKKKHSLNKIKRTGIFNGIFLFFSTYFFMKSTIGNLSIVYTINSFSILVPIILSILIYNEHINLRKSSAIALTILSLFFLK